MNLWRKGDSNQWTNRLNTVGLILSSLEDPTFLVGDARDESTLRRAVKGLDATVSSLGTSVSPLEKCRRNRGERLWKYLKSPSK